MKKGCFRIIKVTAGILAVLLILVALFIGLMHRANGSITSAGTPRKYLLYVPTTYEPSTPTPLVISMHGFGITPRLQMHITQWDDAAEDIGFILVFPMGTGFPLRWGTSPHHGTEYSTVDEVTFIADLIDSLAGEYNIDRTRVYVDGLSNGGGMAHMLACELSDRIAAIGGVSGAYVYPDESCNPSRPVPVIAFHGTDDNLVTYNDFGTDRFGNEHIPIPTWAAAWAQRNQCDSTPEVIPQQGEVSGISYMNCDGDAEVVLYTVHGGGHTWPGGVPLPVFGHTTQDIDGTRTMWEFFSRYALPARE